MATFFTEYADFLESHLEEWTVAKDCAFLRNVPHYIRILPTFVKGDASREGPLGVAAKPAPDGDPNEAVVSVANRNNLQIAASDLLDPGFLELVRFGIRPADDPVITGSVRAIARAVQDQSGGRLPDHRVGIEVLQGAGLMQPPSENYGKRDLDRAGPQAPPLSPPRTQGRRESSDRMRRSHIAQLQGKSARAWALPSRLPLKERQWHRYNEDGYGNYADGRPFDGSGRGRPWPLLTGERGHYELAAGRDPRVYIRAMENFAEPPGLIAEQLWDLPSNGELKYSYPSGSAMPLAWAHAEYITLVRSATDGVVFDLIPAVAERYQAPHSRSNLEIWNFYRQIDVIDRSEKFRIILAWPFRLTGATTAGPTRSA